MLKPENIVFMGEAIKASSHSNDPHCKVGALIAENGLIVATGWNTIDIRGLVSLEDEQDFTNLLYRNRGLKNALCAHAEQMLSKRKARGSELYVTKAMCIDCARLCKPMGIRIVYMPKLDKRSKWYRSQLEALALLNSQEILVIFMNVRTTKFGTPYLVGKGSYEQEETK